MASSPVPSHASHTSHPSLDDHDHDEHDNEDENDNDNDNEGEHDHDHDHDHSGTSKAPALKDKECQYCHQKFTSSSLGRHLDQFISKKKPDGIHDVDEIRRLRGGITRRTARSSHKKEQDEGPSMADGHPPSPQYTLPSYSELVNKTATKEDIRFNRPHWQASGVITDTTTSSLAPVITVASPVVRDHHQHHHNSTTAATATNIAAGQKRSFTTYTADVVSGTNGETVRALELSLREVLDAVRVATQKARPPPHPFDFDFESQTFPYLCLALLLPPPTLFQSTPFATPTSLPLSPPDIDQYQALRKAVVARVDHWKWVALSFVQRSNTLGLNIADEADYLTEQTQMHMDSALAHLDAAYQNFMSYSAESRHNLWTIELLRAFKTEQVKVQSAKAAAERLTQEMSQLQQQLDHLSRCQWPREMALWPPDRPTFDGATQDELRKIHVLRGDKSSSVTAGDTPSSATNSDLTEEQARHNDRWDYDRLLSKWRKRVREDRARRTGTQPTVQILQSGQSTGPSDLSDHPLDSPKPMTSSAPRAMPMYKSNTIGSGSGPELASGPRPVSTTGLAYGVDNSPRTAMDGVRTGGSLSGSGSAPPPGATYQLNHHTGSQYPSASTTAASSTSIFSNIPPPPRSRPLGIISDIDDHLVPRLLGLRGDPPR